MSRLQKYTELPWPMNLYSALSETGPRYPQIPLDEVSLPKDHLATLYYILHAALKDNDFSVIMLRFKEKKTLKESGIAMGITRERVREIESRALRKTVMFTNFRIIMEKGLAYYLKLAGNRPKNEKINAERNATRTDILASIPKDSSIWNEPIGALEISFATNNVLHRKGFRDIKEVLIFSKENGAGWYKQIKGMGPKKVDEFFAAIEKYLNYEREGM